MRPASELFGRQAEQLFARWNRLLVDDPDRLIKEARLYLRWLRRMEPADDDSRAICDILVDMTIEMMIEAILRR